MSGPVSREFVHGRPQERVCACARPAAFADDHGRCTKCGHQAEPELAPRLEDAAREIATALVDVMNRNL